MSRFKVGDKVYRRGNGRDNYGIVVRAFKEGANVEWIGFPPSVPVDGYQKNEGLILKPATRPAGTKE